MVARRTAAALLALVVGSSLAAAQTQNDLGSWRAVSTLSVAGTNPNDALYATPRGTVYDGVASLFIQRTDGNFLCTGALLSGGRDILTAAHCLSSGGIMNTLSVTAVFFPPNQPATFREFAFATAPNAFLIHGSYTGAVIDQHDVGMIRLDAAPSEGITRYDLYTGPTVGETFNIVGSGATGTGNTGLTANGGFTQTDRRQGLNRYDFRFDDPLFGGFWTDPGFFGAAAAGVLLSDFDNGLAGNDASCRIGVFAFGTSAFCDLGTGLREVGLGGGDSGGPAFINNRIASISSFGLTFNPFFGDNIPGLNSSFGEFSGYASVGVNEEFIRMNTVPEPGTLALMGTGLAGLAARWRRRRRS